MISRIIGQLLAVRDGRADLECGALTYELLIPSADEQRLASMLGEDVEFHTLHYLEGQSQGANYLPRLIGFQSQEARAFFELFTTVKGFGNRKTLRAMALPFATIAEAIAAKDVDLLKSLPEIGRRSAETIVAELHGKVDRFVELKPLTDGGPVDSVRGTLIHDASSVLVQLGEAPTTARKLVERALLARPELDSPEALVEAAYRLKD